MELLKFGVGVAVVGAAISHTLLVKSALALNEAVLNLATGGHFAREDARRAELVKGRPQIQIDAE